MRARLLVSTLLLASAPLAAQSPVAKTTPQLPFPGALADTIIVSSFALANGAQFTNPGQLTLDHKLIGGKTPIQFRASRFADFRDVNWVTYPTTVPRFNGNNSGNCTAVGTLKMIVHFQVRAAKTISPEAGVTSFVMSNVARDTTCMTISG